MRLSQEAKAEWALERIANNYTHTGTSGGRKWWENLYKGLTKEIEVNNIVKTLPYIRYTWDGLSDYLRTLGEKTDYRSTNLDFHVTFKQGLVLPIEVKDIHRLRCQYGYAKANPQFFRRVPRNTPHGANRQIPSFIILITEPDAFDSDVHAEVKRRNGLIVRSGEELKTVLDAINRLLNELDLTCHYPLSNDNSIDTTHNGSNDDSSSVVRILRILRRVITYNLVRIGSGNYNDVGKVGSNVIGSIWGRGVRVVADVYAEAGVKPENRHNYCLIDTGGGTVSLLKKFCVSCGGSSFDEYGCRHCLGAMSS